MALLTARRQAAIELEPVSLTRSVDAALGFVCGSAYLAADFVEDMLLALGLQAEAQCAPRETVGILAAALAALPQAGRVPAAWVVDALLDVRSAAGRPVPAGVGA